MINLTYYSINDALNSNNQGHLFELFLKKKYFIIKRHVFKLVKLFFIKKLKNVLVIFSQIEMNKF